MQQKMEPAVKLDSGKLRYDLIPPFALSQIALVYTEGAKKYGDRNWEKGMSWGRIFGAIMRHAWAWMSGQTTDPETGIHHLAHAAWGCIALIEYQRRDIGTDDRIADSGKLINTEHLCTTCALAHIRCGGALAIDPITKCAAYQRA